MFYILLKAIKGQEKAGHKYYKRIPSPTGKGYNYVYKDVKIKLKGRRPSKELSSEEIKKHLGNALHKVGHSYYSHKDPEKSYVVFHHISGNKYQVTTPHGIHEKTVELKTKGDISKHYTEAKNKYKKQLNKKKVIDKLAVKHAKNLKNAVNNIDKGKVSKAKKRINELMVDAVSKEHKQKLKEKVGKILDTKTRKRLGEINKISGTGKIKEIPNILSNLGKMPTNITINQKRQIVVLDKKITDLKGKVDDLKSEKPPENIDNAVKRLNWSDKKKNKIAKAETAIDKFINKAKKHIGELQQSANIQIQVGKGTIKPQWSKYEVGKFHESLDDAKNAGEGDNPAINDLDIGIQNDLFYDFQQHHPNNRTVSMDKWLERYGNKVITDKTYDSILSGYTIAGTTPSTRKEERESGESSVTYKRREEEGKQEEKKAIKEEKEKIKQEGKESKQGTKEFGKLMQMSDEELQRYLHKESA